MRRAGVIYLLLITSVLSLSRLACGSSSSDSSNQVLTLVVQNRRGEFVPDIKADQIVVKGQVASVHSLELDNGPRRILLLLDTSGSMGTYNSSSWANVARFAIEFVQHRRENDLIGVDTFAEKDQMLVPFTIDSRLVARRVETLTTSGRGRTMLVLALSQILDRQDGLRFGDVIILISDGERTEEDKTDMSKVRERLVRAGIRICLIRVPSQEGRTGATDASNFVTAIGGVEMDIASPLQRSSLHVDPETIDAAAKAAYGFVQTFYRITLNVSEPIRKPRQLRLELVDQQKKQIKDLQLSYPSYLLPPPAK